MGASVEVCLHVQLQSCHGCANGGWANFSTFEQDFWIDT